MSETKTLENKAVEILDASQNAIASFADKLTELAKQYGPEVADAALTMARIDAASDLVPAVFILVATALLAKTLVQKWKAWSGDVDPYNPAPILIAVFGGGALAILNVFALITVLDIWRWVGIIEPKLWLAKRILGL